MPKLTDCLRVGVIIYGPYLRKDGRKHVIIYDGKRRQTMSYPKWLMEQKLGRFLGVEETIDHRDRDFTNDAPTNLRIRERKEHARVDAWYARHVAQFCIWCGKQLIRRRNHIRRNAKQKKAGPFCKCCAGRYGAQLQNGQIERLPTQESVKLRHYHLVKDD